MSSIAIIIFVALYWSVPWNKLPALLRGLPWFLLAASFSYLGEIAWCVKLFLVFGVAESIFYVVKNQLNNSEDKKNES